MPPRPLYALRGAKSQIQLHIVGIFNADVGQIAEMAHVIKAVTYYEFVWYNKAHIVRRNGSFAPFGLIEQAGYPKACRLAGFQYVCQVVKGKAAVHNILNYKHMAAGYRKIHVL